MPEMNRMTLFPVGHGLGKWFQTINWHNLFRGQSDSIYKMNSAHVAEPEFHLQEFIQNIQSSIQRGIHKDVYPTVISNRGILFSHQAIKKDELHLIPAHLVLPQKVSMIYCFWNCGKYILIFINRLCVGGIL